ncbi:MAG: tetratricopeptide repeat protein [Bacteroidales bacterium]|nr:tetratricopeptide repeat protein [Bacteroidales bacterium]
MQKIGMCLLLACLLLAGPVMAGSDGELWQEANDAYRRKDYGTAVSLYEKLIANEAVSADLYYNMGNACYRLNRLGEALLWYERALRLQPSNADIRANIAFVNSQTVDQMEVLPELFLKRWFSALRNLFSQKGWAVFSILCALLFFIVLAFFLLAGDLRRRVRLLVLDGCLLLLLALGVGMAIAQKRALERTDEAIVTALSVSVRSMPDASGTELFTVHEGMKVRLTDEVGEWVEAQFPNGSKGWVLSRQLTVI